MRRIQILVPSYVCFYKITPGLNYHPSDHDSVAVNYGQKRLCTAGVCSANAIGHMWPARGPYLESHSAAIACGHEACFELMRGEQTNWSQRTLQIWLALKRQQVPHRIAPSKPMTVYWLCRIDAFRKISDESNLGLSNWCLLAFLASCENWLERANQKEFEPPFYLIGRSLVPRPC